MPARIAGKSSNSRTPRPTINAVRHTEAWRETAATVATLVGRLQRGKELLDALPADHADREDYQELYSELVLRLWDAMRDCYCRYALVRVAIGPMANDLWLSLMPSAETLEPLGLQGWYEWVRGRLVWPGWITDAERELVVRDIPVQGFREKDVLSRGLSDWYAAPPFD